MNILVDLANVPPIPIPLGKDEQNAFNTVIFDARAWGADFPGATYTVLYQRPTGDIYPVLVNQPGPLISWTPSAADTTIIPNAPAFARAEIRLMQGDALGKSATAVFGLTAGILSEAPAAPTPDWVTTVAQDAAKAEAAVAHYPQLIDGDLWIWNPTSEQWEKLIISEGGNPNAVLFTEQTLSDAQKAQARSNIDAATPSDIPSAPEMATSPTMTDWTSGKTVDAGAAKTYLDAASETVSLMASAVTLNSNARHTHSNKSTLDDITANDLLPSVSSSDNGKFLRVVSGAWAAVVVPDAESNSFGGGS